MVDANEDKEREQREGEQAAEGARNGCEAWLVVEGQSDGLRVDVESVQNVIRLLLHSWVNPLAWLRLLLPRLPKLEVG